MKTYSVQQWACYEERHFVTTDNKQSAWFNCIRPGIMHETEGSMTTVLTSAVPHTPEMIERINSVMRDKVASNPTLPFGAM